MRPYASISLALDSRFIAVKRISLRLARRKLSGQPDDTDDFAASKCLVKGEKNEAANPRPKNEGKTMKLKIDREADALYLTLDESDIFDSEEGSPGITVD